MNDEELEIAKKIADIEGERLIIYKDNLCALRRGSGPVEYNPFNWSILGPLMVKYEVEVCYRYKEVALWVESTWIKVPFQDKAKIPRTILECIIKSKEA